MNIQDKIVENLIEIVLKKPDNFLIVAETLKRIGIASKHENKLFQSCHILHKRGKYYIVHFKQLFQLDSKPTDLLESDIARTNSIANILASWGLIDLVDKVKSESPIVPLSQIKILSKEESKNWQLCSKYTIGNKKHF